MLDSKNVWIGQGGVVFEPEVIQDKILKLRIGVDYAASEKGSENTSGSGYFFDFSLFAIVNVAMFKILATSPRVKMGFTEEDLLITYPKIHITLCTIVQVFMSQLTSLRLILP